MAKTGTAAFDIGHMVSVQIKTFLFDFDMLRILYRQQKCIVSRLSAIENVVWPC